MVYGLVPFPDSCSIQPINLMWKKELSSFPWWRMTEFVRSNNLGLCSWGWWWWSPAPCTSCWATGRSATSSARSVLQADSVTFTYTEQFYTAMDVTCCTVSILHLCAVSVDRYYAIVREPLLYQVTSALCFNQLTIKITWGEFEDTKQTILWRDFLIISTRNRDVFAFCSILDWYVYLCCQNERTIQRTALMILLAWLLGLLVGFMSVFSGIYTTSQAMDTHEEQPDHCEFEVGKERRNYKINSLWLNINMS